MRYVVLSLVVATLALAAPAMAQQGGYRGGPSHQPPGAPQGGTHQSQHQGEHHSQFQHDYGHFTPHEHNVWRGGYWHNGARFGRYGWWWVVSGEWYFYDAPVYPYPTVVTPLYFAVPSPPVYYNPPLTGAPPQQFWSYCAESDAYYPYVPSCPGLWRQVPVTQQ